MVKYDRPSNFVIYTVRCNLNETQTFYFGYKLNTLFQKQFLQSKIATFNPKR